MLVIDKLIKEIIKLIIKIRIVIAGIFATRNKVIMISVFALNTYRRDFLTKFFGIQ
jgi:hypothetical protein